MAKERDIEIELAKLKQQIEDMAGTMRYGGGDRSLVERLDKLIEVLSAAAMEEEERGESNKLDMLIEALTEEREDETDLAMQEVARSLTGIADAMRENTELLRETVKKLEVMQSDLEEELPPKREAPIPEEVTERAPLPPEKSTPIEEPAPPQEPPPETDLAKGIRGMELLEEKMKTKKTVEVQPEKDMRKSMDLFGEKEIPQEESLEDILAEAEELGIDTSLIKGKRSVGGSILPYLLGIFWLFIGIMKFLSPQEIPFLVEIDELIMENTVGMLFSILLIITGIPMIFIGMQGSPKKKTKIFNILSYVTGGIWMAVGIVFLMYILQETPIEEMILFPLTGMMLFSGMLSIFIGVSISQKKFSV